MNVTAVGAVAPGVNSADSAKLKDAAGKFEAMLIAQMLKSARKTDSGGWSGESDESTSSLMDMAEQQLADMLGAQGGLGLAQMVVTQLAGKTAGKTGIGFEIQRL